MHARSPGTRRRPSGGIRRRWRAIAAPGAAAAAILLVACSGGGGSSPGGGPDPAHPVRLTALSLPSTLHAGHPAPVGFRILTHPRRRRVPVNLELVPLGDGELDAAVTHPRDPAYGAMEVGGLTVEHLGAGEEREVLGTVDLAGDLPPGRYAAVLRADKYDWFDADDRDLPAAPHRAPAAPFVVAVAPVVVAVPDLPDIRVVSLSVAGRTFRAAASGGIGPGVDGAPETGDAEAEGAIAATVVLSSLGMPAAGAVRVRFELGIPDGDGGPTAWHPLEVIDRTDAADGTVLLAEASLDPPGDAANALEAGERRGLSADLVLPEAARDALMAREDDAVCILRATADPAEDHPEWNEDPPGANNILEVPIVHLGPLEAVGHAFPDMVAGAAPDDAAAEAGPGDAGSFLLLGDRLDGANTYPLRAFAWNSGKDYGDPSALAVGYDLSTSLTYSPSTIAAIPSGRRIALRIPARGDRYLQADDAGGSASGYGDGVGTWERFTMEIVSRAGSLYEVRLRAADGVHCLSVDAVNYKGSAYRRVGFRLPASDPSTVFHLTDANGGELASGDAVTLDSAGVPVVALAQGLGRGTGAPATSMRILDADPASLPRKAKFITDNRVDFDVFDRHRSLLKVAAAAEFDSEDVVHTYFDWEVLVVGAKVWGAYCGVEASGGTIAAATLWNSAVSGSGGAKALAGPAAKPCPRPSNPAPPPAEPPPKPSAAAASDEPECSLPPTEAASPSRYAKHEEKEARTSIWIGPVPVAVRAGGQGTLGVRGAVWIGANNRLVAEAGPLVSFTAYASAGLDVGFASVAVRGELTILRVSMLFRGTVQIAVGDTAAKFTLSGPLTLATMDGRVFVRATWDVLLVQGTKDWDIMSWSGWTKTWDLFPPKTWEW